MNDKKASLVDKQVERALKRETGLRRGMRSRHIFMISLGGVIGTGLFMGSGHTLGAAGPLGAVLAYIAGGFSMYMVMLCLGELAVAIPVAGSFLAYGREFVHPAASFTVGWMYWISCVVVIAADLIVAALILTSMFPSTSLVFWILFWLAILTLFNCLSVNIFGEAEFWFCSFKVIAIICLIIVGIGIILGIIGPGADHPAIMLTRYTQDGLFPNGIKPVFATMIIVAFAFSGTEIIGITAGESDNPETTIPKAVNNTAFRTLFFYVASIFVIAAIVPWQTAGVSESIFAEVFAFSGIPYAYAIMNLVVVTSALSSANSWLYTVSRTMWSMARDGMAPSYFGKLSRHQVPLRAMFFTVICSLVGLLAEKYAASTVYIALITMAGLSGILCWLMICVAQINFRRRIVAAGKLDTLRYKTPFFPLVPILGLLTNVVVMIGSYFDPDTRIGVIALLPFVIASVICYFIFIAPKHKAEDAELYK